MSISEENQMKIKIRSNILFLVTIYILLLIAPSLYAKNYIIASGEVNGIYFPLAGAIAQLSKSKNYQLVVKPTGGAQENFQLLTSGKVDFAIMQSDMISRKFKKDKTLTDKLRLVQVLYDEAVSILISPTSRIRKIKDIKGKTIVIGTKTSGSYQNASEILKTFLGKEWRSQVQVLEKDLDDAIEMMMNHKLDAIIRTIGHPNNVFIKTNVSNRVFHFLSIKRKEHEKIKELYPYYFFKKFSTKDYFNIKERNFKTVSIKALLVTRKDVPCSVTSNVVNIFKKYPLQLRKKIPQLRDFTKKIPTSDHLFKIPHTRTHCVSQ